MRGNRVVRRVRAAIERHRVGEPRRQYRRAAAAFPRDGVERECAGPRCNKHELLFGVLFHPEVAHTPRGGEILHNFLFTICGCMPDWTPGHYIEQEVERIRELVGPTRRAICGLSGGVDSAVAAALVHRAIGDRLTCIFVDHGLLRLNEREQVERTWRSPGDRFADGGCGATIPQGPAGRPGSGRRTAAGSGTPSSTSSRRPRATWKAT